MRLPGFALFGVLALGLSAAAQTETGRHDSFASARLSASETREIIAILEQQAFDTPNSWDSELRVERVDLGAGSALVVQGTQLLCGGTGNCQLFVLRRNDGRWASLFDVNEAPIVDGFQFGPAVTNGIKDLTATTHVSADQTTRVTYQFDGRFYRAR